MKILSKALLAAGLVALSACGGGAEENTAATNVGTEDLYNVAPDDLGTENVLGNETLGNDLGLENSVDTNTGAEANATETNSQ